jgi:hypothetical protein
MLRFTLIDFTTDYGGIATIIDEPVGWDAVSLRLKRTTEWHGFFNFFDDTNGSLQFDGAGYSVLKNAYETDGAQARVNLLIEYSCADNDDYETIYSGQFNFGRSYRDLCGDRCYVEVGLENTSCIVTFKNRYDQKVDLDSLEPFDDVCVPEEYEIDVQFVAPVGGGPNIINLSYFAPGIEAGDTVIISGSVSNDGVYTVISNVYAFGVSQLVVEEAVVDEAIGTVTVTGCLDPCEGDEIEVLVEFYNPEFIVVHADLSGLEPGDTFVVTGSGSNGGTFTVLSSDWTGIKTIIVVVELVTTEGATVGVTVTLSGCLFAPLVRYEGLNKEISLPSKTIRLTTQWKTKDDISYSFADAPPPIENPGRMAITPDWANIISEIDETRVGTGLFITGTGGAHDTFDAANPPDELIVFNGSGGQLGCVGDTNIELSFEYNFDWGNLMIPNGEFRIYVVKDTAFNPPYTGQTAGPQQWYWDLDDSAGFHAFNETINTTVVEGETIWIFFTIRYNLPDPLPTPIPDPLIYPSLNFKANSFFKSTIDSECDPTQSKVYLINEVMSRITEAYTNDCLRVKSDYFGRIDSQPYTSEENGCGALTSITNGLKIRAKNDLVPIGDSEKTPKVTVSMKEVFEAMNAIHCIGMGIEDDPNRPGNQLIRVEPKHYFYKPDVLITCDHIKKVEREIHPTELYSILKAGYAKWETENANGLNDPFGNREYRTLLTTIRNTCDRICKFIASDYAIEVTRRKYGSTTKDWKYDNDIFIICLQSSFTGQIAFYATGDSIEVIGIHLIGVKVGDSITIEGSASNDGTYTVTAISYSAPGAPGLVFTQITVAEALVNEAYVVCTFRDITNPLRIVETGNVASSSGLLYPDTCYNLRITPARNAMRHFKTILMSYRKYLIGRLKFTNGDGNYLAQIQLDADDCLNEVDGLLAENADIDLDKFNDPDSHHPTFWPERVKYEYPVTWEQYKDIAANPYGTVEFQCGDGDMEEGYIEDFQLKPTGPNGGLATFTLKTKIPV